MISAIGFTPADPAAVYEDNGFHARISRLEKQHASAEDVVLKLYERMTALEQMCDADMLAKQPSNNLTLRMQELAVKLEAAQFPTPENLYAPLRTDTGPLIRLTALARRMLDPSDLGHAVTEEVRDLAREALGIERVTSTRP